MFREKAGRSILPEPDPVHEIRYIGEDSDLYPVLLYLHTRYQEKVTIEMLCEEFHTNRTSLQQKFSRITGKNIKEYLQDLRLRLSSMMLRDTTVPIQDIAERTGYGDLNQFSRMFRQKTGLDVLAFMDLSLAVHGFIAENRSDMSDGWFQPIQCTYGQEKLDAFIRCISADLHQLRMFFRGRPGAAERVAFPLRGSIGQVMAFNVGLMMGAQSADDWQSLPPGWVPVVHAMILQAGPPLKLSRQPPTAC